MLVYKVSKKIHVKGVYFSDQGNQRPTHLYVIFEKLSWKNQVRGTGFLVYFKLDFYCLCRLQKSISKSIFAG